MANNLTNLNEIITTMRSEWTSFTCAGTEGDPNNSFLFGWSHEVDEVHNKDMALMVMNVPSSSSSTVDIDRETVKTNTSFTCQIYKYSPSKMTGQTDVYKAVLWDNIEGCFYYWLQRVLNNMGSRVQMGAGSLQITRTKQSSNDQLFQIECRFNLDYWRYCIELN